MGVRLTFIWLKDTLVGCGTAAEVANLNSLSCRNSVPTNSENWVTFGSRDCHVLDYQII